MVFCILPVALLPVRAGGPRSPIETAGFGRLTAYDTLRAFLWSLDRSPGIDVERTATSRLGRDVFIVRVSASPVFGADSSKLRVLLFGQQHGDEPTGKEALTMLLAQCASGEMASVLATCDLLVVPQMNPDGAEAGRRRTADSLDLNRSHVLLHSPETRALHDLYARWMPHVTMDIHQYGAYSTSWSDGGFIKAADVQLGMLTNLNTGAAIRRVQHEEIFPFIAGRMGAAGYTFHEYIVGSPAERIRHSTTEFNDGRQSFGVQGSVSFIQEGIRWDTPEQGLERCVRSQLASVEGLLAWCSGNAASIRRIVEEERRRLAGLEGGEVVLRMDHEAGSGVLDIPVRLTARGVDTTWRVTPYHDRVVPRATCTMPAGYLIRRADSAVASLLSRHQIEMQTVVTGRRVRVQEAHLGKVDTEVLEEDTIPRPQVRWEERESELGAGDVVVPTAQVRGLLASLLLEPESAWGMVKYPEFAWMLERVRLPVLRIVGE
jgi:hypothetical protein